MYARQRCEYEIKGKEIWGRNFLDDLLTWYYLLYVVSAVHELWQNSDLSNYNMQMQVNQWW